MKRWTAKFRKLLRNDDGDSIAEFGPALMVLLLALFFPMIDLLSLGTSYALCMVLNYNQVHEASLIPYTDAISPSGAIVKGIPDQWLNGMGKFVKTVGRPDTAISYRGSDDPKAGSDKTVIVQTTVQCNPFLPLPLPMVNIPGVNGPMTFTIVSERAMEEPDNGPDGPMIADTDEKGTVGSLSGLGGTTGPAVDPTDDKGTVDLGGFRGCHRFP